MTTTVGTLLNFDENRTFTLTSLDVGEILNLSLFKAEFCSCTFRYLLVHWKENGGMGMDARVDIVNNIMEGMRELVSGCVANQLEELLLAELNKYEVQERTTDIVVRDGTSEGLLRKFLATKRVEGKSENTLEYYSRTLQIFLLELDRRLYEVTAFDLRYYLAAYKEKKKVGNRTLDNMRKVLSSFFGWLADEGFIPKNPCRSLKQIKYDKAIRKPFSKEEMEKLRTACTNPRDLALVHFLYSTGCRVSEVVMTDIQGIDFSSRELVVYGKGGKERVVYLTEVAVMYLEQYLSQRTDSSKALFVGKRSERIQKNAIESIVRNLGKIAGVENVHPHRFRRTLATNMINNGAPIQIVQAILGHEDIRTTQVYYTVCQENVKRSFGIYMR